MKYHLFYSLFISSMLSFFCLSTQNIAHAQPERLTIHARNVPIQAAITLLTEILHINVIQSASVQGSVSLDFDKVDPQQALTFLLQTQTLGQRRAGDNYYIAPLQELLKQTEATQQLDQQLAKHSPLSHTLIQLRFTRAAYLAHLLQPLKEQLLSNRGSIQTDTYNNALLIVDIPKQVAQIKSLIKQLDRPVKQIKISARIISVDSDCEQVIGLKLPIYRDIGHAKQAATIGHYPIILGRLADATLLDIKLAALERQGHARLISSPTLFTANLEPALIESGEEVPYQEVSESGGTAVTFKKAVLGLEVTPEILADNKVLLKLKINQDRPSQHIVQGVPTINTRKILSSVMLDSAKTLVLGGIFESADETGENSIPWVRTLPLIGTLLSSHDNRMSKRELLIFVTPTIIH